MKWWTVHAVMGTPDHYDATRVAKDAESRLNSTYFDSLTRASQVRVRAADKTDEWERIPFATEGDGDTGTDPGPARDDEQIDLLREQLWLANKRVDALIGALTETLAVTARGQSPYVLSPGTVMSGSVGYGGGGGAAGSSGRGGAGGGG